MADDTVQIRFGADTSGVTAGAGEVKTQLTGLHGAVSSLAAGLKALAATAVAGFSDTAAGAGKVLASLGEASAAATEAHGSFSALGQTLAKAFPVQPIANFAEKLASTAAENQRVAQTIAPVAAALAAVAGVVSRLVGTAFSAWWAETTREASRAWQAVKATVSAVADMTVKVATFIGQSLASDFAGIATQARGAATAVGGFLQANFPGVVSAWDGWIKTLKVDLDAASAAFRDFLGVAAGAPNAGASALGAAAAQIAALGQNPKPPGPKVSNHGGANKGDDDKSQMEAWQGDLRDAEESIREHTGAWLADMQNFELSFWRQKLAQATKGSKDYQQLVAKVDELTLATHKTAGERQLEDDRKLIEAKKGNWTEELAALQQAVTDTTRLYGQGARQAKEAATLEADAIKQHNAEMISAQIKGLEQLAAAQQRQATQAVAMAKVTTNDQLAAVKQLYDLGELSARSYAARVDALHKQDTAEQLAALQQQLTQISTNYATQLTIRGQTDAQLSAADQKYLDDFMAVQAKIAEVTRAGNRQLVADQNDAILKLKAQWDGFVNPMVTTFTDGLLKMAEGTRTFRQVMLDLGQNLLQDMTRNVAKLVERWLWGELGRKLATTAANDQILASNEKAGTEGVAINALSNLKRIQSDAGAAAAAAYKAMAGIFPAPLWGIAAGAAAYAGVMAFEGLASAAGGFDVPRGVNPITQLHQQEMVLPASIANPMRNFFSGSGSPAAASIGNGAGTGGGGGGDAHLHYAPVINAPQPQSLKQMLTDQGADMISFVQAAIRNRSLKFA